MVPEIEVRKPICEAFQSGRLDAFGAVDDAAHPAQVEPARSPSVVLRAARSKAKLGAAEKARGFSASARIHLAGFPRTLPGS